MAVTMKDIAERLGVSVMTVSYALRGTGSIGAETRERILDTARELGYRPNGGARATRTGRFDAVGFAFSSSGLHGNVPKWLLRSVGLELNAQGRHLLAGVFDQARIDEPDYVPQILSDWRVDGLLVGFAQRFPASLERVIKRGAIPAVWVNRKLATGAVHPDDHGAGATAARRLLELGHRRIAYIDSSNPFPEVHYSAEDRRAGVRAALAEAGLEPVEILRPPADTDKRGILVDRLCRLLDAGDRPSAFISYASSDFDVVRILAAQRGLRIPQDLSCIGFDDHLKRDLLHDLATMRLPWDGVARHAVERLGRAIDGSAGTRFRSIAVPFALHPGDTLAPPRAG